MSSVQREPKLSDAHQRLVDESAISPEVSEERGYRTVTKKSELSDLGFGRNQCRVPALLIPIHGVTGEIVLYQARPNDPRVNEKGKALKYETPARSRMVLDVPPRVRPQLGDLTKPLFITEGARKADSAASRGLTCIALLGVWNWRGSNGSGGKVALPDWESIALNGRDVYVVFDSDVTTKVEVRSALQRLSAFLGNKGASVRQILLPCGAGGSKVGLDDFFASGHSVDDLLGCTSPDDPQDAPADGDPRYESDETGIIWNKPTREGSYPVQLTNFQASILFDVARDDGVEVTRAFEIEARIGTRTQTISVSAAEFSAMNWHIEHLGSSAVLYAGQSVRDNVRVAIQLLSSPEPRRIYTHTGWRRIDDQDVYLHGGGAIGPRGPVSGVTVELLGELSKMRLPSPPEGDALVSAIKASLRLLDVGPDRVMIPILAATYRSVLGPIDCSVFVVGETGAGKTEIASRAMQHFGSEFRREQPPASWMSTGNSLEIQAFTAKDALLLVDDFCPSGSPSDVQRCNREADRVLRAQGNRSGRGRLSSDGTLRPGKPPRGLILSTGEDVPRGHSLRARSLIVEVRKDDIDFDKLTQAQEDGANGLFAGCMAGYLRSLSERFESFRQEMSRKLRERRNAASAECSHRRTPGILADLFVGLEFFLEFAVTVGALSDPDRRKIEVRAWKALLELADEQASHHASSEPTARFLELIASAIGSGAAHIAGVDGAAPPKNAGAWGWREIQIGAGENASWDWRPQGSRIGWLHGEALYLDRDAAYRVCQVAVGVGGDGIAVSPVTLVKRLAERKLLASTDPDRNSLLVRRTVEGKRRHVVHLAAETILSTQNDADDGWRESEAEIDGASESLDLCEAVHVGV